MMKIKQLFTAMAVVFAVAMTGCASMNPTELEQRLKAEQVKNANLESSIKGLQENLRIKDAEITKMKGQSMQVSTGGDSELLPPNAKPGECYARTFVPPQYTTSSKQVLKTAAYDDVTVTKPEYGMVEKQVLVSEASTELKVIPARYEWAEEKVVVADASEQLNVIPASYDNVGEKVLISPAYTTWKKGRGPIERVDHATGEIMCLVEVPAQYKTVSKRVQLTPESVQKVAIPAKYRMVRKKVLAEPAKTVEVPIPAEYKTVKVRQVIRPPQEMRTTIPATYQTVKETKLVSEGKLDWRPILCETNTTPDVVRNLQSSLRTAGYSPGPIDGVIGRQTRSAVNRYQSDKGIARGSLTLETLKKLGVI